MNLYGDADFDAHSNANSNTRPDAWDVIAAPGAPDSDIRPGDLVAVTNFGRGTTSLTTVHVTNRTGPFHLRIVGLDSRNRRVDRVVSNRYQRLLPGVTVLRNPDASYEHEEPDEVDAGDPSIRSTQWLRDHWLQYRCAEHEMVGLRLLSHRTPVNPRTVDAFRALGKALTDSGYVARSTWNYTCRSINDSAKASLHSYGLAVDIDPSSNPHRKHRTGLVRFSGASTQAERGDDVVHGRADTAFTPQQVSAVEAIRTVDGLQVFAWGGRWSGQFDSMHFQLNVSPEELERGLAGESNVTDANAEDDEVRIRMVTPTAAQRYGTMHLENGFATRSVARLEPTEDPRDLAIVATSSVEGGPDTVNLYDRGILSWGIMQWTAHAGSLQQMLTFMQKTIRTVDPRRWSSLFGGLSVTTSKRSHHFVYESQPVVTQTELRMLFRGSAVVGESHPETAKRWVRTFALAGRDREVAKLQLVWARRRLDALVATNLAQRFKDSSYRVVGEYLAGSPLALTLLFGTWTQNPRDSWRELKWAIDTLPKPMTGDAFAAHYEQVLRASKLHTWGDAVTARKYPDNERQSRTQKLVDGLHVAQAKVRSHRN